MEQLNWLVIEMLSEQTLQERRGRAQPLASGSTRPREERSGIKRSLAASLVRLGLRLDPAAGEGLGAFELSLARPEARRQA